jgi:hypothetical protein
MVLLGFIACKKDSTSGNEIDTSLTDTISENRYYSQDVFPPQYADLYGIWKLNLVSGGFTGSNQDLAFDYLILKQNGIYCVVDNNMVMEFGKMVISNQLDECMLTEFVPDSLSKSYVGDFEKCIDLSRKDTLMLHAPCCDRFDFVLSRLK